jgi:cytochrome P450
MIPDAARAVHDLRTRLFVSYEEMRALGPIVREPETGYYVVVDYAILKQIATDTKRFSNSTGLIAFRSGELGERMREIQREQGVPIVPALLTTDPPAHQFYRSLVDKALTPVRVKKLEMFLNDVVDEIIDDFINRGEVEFVSEMATLVPVNVVAAILGVSRDRVADIRRWSDAASSGNDPTLTDEQKLETVRVTCELQRFMLDQANIYRKTPNDSLLSNLANFESDGRQLNDSELISIAQQIIIAGHETTASVMASAVHWMIHTPGLEDELRAHPALLNRFIEEVLRLESPLQGMFRRTTEDVEVGGMPIPKESIVVMRWGAGNRDPEAFPDPAGLHVHQPAGRQHLAFGFGAHFCIGNQLARAELRISLAHMLARMKNFRLVDKVDRISHYFIYGISKMHVAFDKNM